MDLFITKDCPDDPVEWADIPLRQIFLDSFHRLLFCEVQFFQFRFQRQGAHGQGDRLSHKNPETFPA